ncbi:MAG: InlB B-repeat-containing protein [Bacilli bacterium]|nr:InlB B-repeat-containing protein [Bacilli bacterium]
MKKIGLLVVPIVAVSLLANCNNHSPITHTFTFTGENCTINGETSYSHDIYEQDKNVQYTIKPNKHFALPETLGGDVVNYDKATGVITIPEVKSDINVTAVADPIEQDTCLVSFDACGGKVTSTNPITVELSQPIQPPTLDDREGYDKSKVKWLDKSGNEFNFEAGTTNDIVLYAKWGDIKQYKVSFKDDQGRRVTSDQFVNYAEKIQRPVTPSVPAGYSFDNWYDAESGGSVYDFDKELKGPEQEITIYAHFNLIDCHINYVTNGGVITGSPTTSVKYGETIITAPTIEREGFDPRKVSWWLDPAMSTQRFVFGDASTGTPVTGNIDLYARWDVQKFAVEFYENNDKAEPTIQIVEQGKKATYYTPKKGNQKFLGWYSDKTRETLYDFNTPIEKSDIKLYAKWDSPFYTLTYQVCDVSGTTFVEHYAPTEPTVKPGWEPTYATYTFVGWYTAKGEGQGEEFEFGKTLSSDTYIYAHWAINPPSTICTLNFNLENCKVYDMDGKEVPTVAYIPVSPSLPPPLMKFRLAPNGGGFKMPKNPDVLVTRAQGSDPVDYTYSEETGEIEFTVSENLNIVAYSYNVDIKYWTWLDIDRVSTMGRAKEFFKIGDEKVITLYNTPHKARIIGFDHDPLASDPSKSAGITFEFENVVTKNGTYADTQWDKRYNTNFPGSVFDGTLKSLLNDLPPDLSKVVKEVHKPVGVGRDYSVKQDYCARLFALSVREMHTGDIGHTAEEGSTYEYYRGSVSKVKTIVDGESVYYWLRSPFTDNDFAARYVDDNGTFQHAEVSWDHTNGFSPAFCI